MDFPELTYNQVLILECIGTSQLKGRELRNSLSGRGLNKSGPAFYQMMSRLEESGFVEGWYDQKIIDGQIIKERAYRVTGKGQKALHETLRLYEERVRQGATGGLTGGIAYA